MLHTAIIFATTRCLFLSIQQMENKNSIISTNILSLNYARVQVTIWYIKEFTRHFLTMTMNSQYNRDNVNCNVTISLNIILILVLIIKRQNNFGSIQHDICHLNHRENWDCLPKDSRVLTKWSVLKQLAAHLCCFHICPNSLVSFFIYNFFSHFYGLISLSLTTSSTS